MKTFNMLDDEAQASDENRFSDRRPDVDVDAEVAAFVNRPKEVADANGKPETLPAESAEHH